MIIHKLHTTLLNHNKWEKKEIATLGLSVRKLCLSFVDYFLCVFCSLVCICVFLVCLSVLPEMVNKHVLVCVCVLQRRFSGKQRRLFRFSSDVVQSVKRCTERAAALICGICDQSRLILGNYVLQEAQSGSGAPIPRTPASTRVRVGRSGSERALRPSERKRKWRRACAAGSRVVSRERWRHGEHPVGDRRRAHHGRQTEAA